MSHQHQIAKSTILQYVSKIISTLLGLIAIGLITRYLGNNGYGLYSTIMGYLLIFATVSDLGMTLTLPQMLGQGRHSDQTIISNIFTMRFLSSTLFLGLGALLVLLTPYEPAVKIGIALTTLSFLAMALVPSFVGFFQKQLTMFYASVGEVLNRVVLLVGIIGAQFFDLGLFGILGAVILSNFSQLIIVYLPTRKFFATRLAFDKIVWQDAWHKTWPIALSITFNLIYLRLDTPILAIFRDPAEVGLYGAAYKVIDVLTSFPFIFAGLLLPLLTNFWQSGDYQRFKELIQHGFDTMAILALPLVIGTYFVAHDAMALIAGENFRAAGTILQLLIFAQGIIFLNVIFAHAIVALDAQRKTIWAYALAAGIGLIGYLIMIPLYGALGAAIMTIITETLVAVLITAQFMYFSKIKPKFNKWPAIIISSLAMALVLWRLAGFNLIIQLSLASLTYIIMIVLLRGISRNFLKELWLLRRS